MRRRRWLEQLLFLELLLKLSGGLVLLLVPLAACRVLGLPRPDHGIWPRLLGVVLIGIGGSALHRGRFEERPGAWFGGAGGHQSQRGASDFRDYCLEGWGAKSAGPVRTCRSIVPAHSSQSH